jgi:hypothetical protein
MRSLKKTNKQESFRHRNTPHRGDKNTSEGKPDKFAKREKESGDANPIKEKNKKKRKQKRRKRGNAWRSVVSESEPSVSHYAHFWFSSGLALEVLFPPTHLAHQQTAT